MPKTVLDETVLDETALTPTPTTYEADFHAWTQAQAALLHARRFHELDLQNLIDEVTALGGSDRQQIERRLDVLTGHLLKWRYQPGQRNSHWTGTILKQRRRLARLLRASPSLRRYPTEVFAECYQSGRLLASRETGIALVLFPQTPPFTLEQVLDPDFLPKDADLLDQS